MRKLTVLTGLLAVVCITGFAESRSSDNPYLEKYQNLVNQTQAQAVAQARENQEAIEQTKREASNTAQAQAPASQPATPQPTANPWVKPNPWTNPPAQNPAAATAPAPAPNIFAPPKAPATTENNPAAGH